MAIELVPLGTLTLGTRSVTVIAGGPISGRRVIVELCDVRIDGERLRGTQHGGTAGDWLIVGPDDTAIIDVRFCIKTHDGALVYVHAGGRADARTFGTGGATYLAPVFETADERYLWLNKVQAVAKGSGTATTATFELFEVR